MHLKRLSKLGSSITHAHGIQRIFSRNSQRTSVTPHYDPTDWTRDRFRTVSKSLYYSSDDWIEEPLLPEIVPDPKTLEGIKFIRRKEGDAVASLPTSKQKMDWFAYMEVPLEVKKKHRMQDSAQRKWQPFHVVGFPSVYNATPVYQYLTRTCVKEGLPNNYYDFVDEITLKSIVDKVREPVIDCLMVEKRFFFRNDESIPAKEREMVKPAHNIIDNIMRSVEAVCSQNFPHLLEMQIDLNANVHAFWKRSGYIDQGLRIECCHPKSGEVLIQFKEDHPVYRILRHEHPLPEVLPRESSFVTTIDVPQANYTPLVFGFRHEESIPKWIPGFHFGDPCEFSALSINVPKNWDSVVESIEEIGAQENLVANCVVGAFGRVVAQAAYLGFSILNELTYPIVTQSIMTTGRDWIFSTYQANTIAVWKQDGDNPYQNICWATKPMKLFDHVSSDGVVGFNDEVLSNFIKQYLKPPLRNPGINLRPYLANPEKSYWKSEYAGVPFTGKRSGTVKRPRKYDYKPEL